MQIRQHSEHRARSGGALRPLEQQVLAEVASGATNDEIAARLGYSASYIKDVVATARERLHARDRAHAAALAVSLGVVRRRTDNGFTAIGAAEDPLASSSL